MEKRGLVRRQRDSTDRRIYRIWLTPAGQELQAVLLPKLQKLNESIFQDLTAEEKATFARLLDRLDESNR